MRDHHERVNIFIMRNSPERFNSSLPKGAVNDNAAEPVAIHVIKNTRRAKSPEQAKVLVGNDMRTSMDAECASSETPIKNKRVGTAEKILSKQEELEAYVEKKEAEIRTRELTEHELAELREALAQLKSSAEDLQESDLTPKERAGHEKEFLAALKQLEARKRKGFKLVESVPELSQNPAETESEDLPLQPKAPATHEASGIDDVELDPTTRHGSAHETTPEAELVEQLYRIFGDDTESWDRIRKTPAPFFLRQGMSATPAEAALKSYIRDLMSETGLEPKGRILGFNETIEGFIMRAIEKLYGDNK
jgi:hypothetical protein